MTEPTETSEIITTDAENHAHREFWSQPMEYQEVVYLGGGIWEVTNRYETSKGSAEIQ